MAAWCIEGRSYGPRPPKLPQWAAGSGTPAGRVLAACQSGAFLRRRTAPGRRPRSSVGRQRVAHTALSTREHAPAAAGAGGGRLWPRQRLRPAEPSLLHDPRLQKLRRWAAVRGAAEGRAHASCQARAFRRRRPAPGRRPRSGTGGQRVAHTALWVREVPPAAPVGTMGRLSPPQRMRPATHLQRTRCWTSRAARQTAAAGADGHMALPGRGGGTQPRSEVVRLPRLGGVPSMRAAHSDRDPTWGRRELHRRHASLDASLRVDSRRRSLGRCSTGKARCSILRAGGASSVGKRTGLVAGRPNPPPRPSHALYGPS